MSFSVIPTSRSDSVRYLASIATRTLALPTGTQNCLRRHVKATASNPLGEERHEGPNRRASGRWFSRHWHRPEARYLSGRPLWLWLRLRPAEHCLGWRLTRSFVHGANPRSHEEDTHESPNGSARWVTRHRSRPAFEAWRIPRRPLRLRLRLRLVHDRQSVVQPLSEMSSRQEDDHEGTNGSASGHRWWWLRLWWRGLGPLFGREARIVPRPLLGTLAIDRQQLVERKVRCDAHLTFFFLSHRVRTEAL